MKFKNTIVVMLALCLLLFASTAAAVEQKYEWKNPDYDVSKVKVILISMPDANAANLAEADWLDLKWAYQTAFNKSQKRWAKLKHPLIFITIDELEQKVSEYTGLDMKQLAQENPKQHAALLQEYIPLSSDAVLAMNIKEYRSDRVFVPEYTYTYTEQVETEVKIDVQNADGTWSKRKVKVRHPVERVRTEPAHYVTYGKAGMEYILTDNKTQTRIWSLIDRRDAVSKAPINLTTNIMSRTADRMAKLF